MTSRTRTVFLGTGAFAVPVLSALAGHPDVDLISVITAPLRIGSRGKAAQAPVAQWAAAHGVPLLRPQRLRSDESVADIRALGPALLVLADYGQIVPATLLDLPRHGALNVHPSLLPRYRGATPIPAAILAGDAETGVTLMRMDAGLDTGPIVAQSRVTLTGTETAPELEELLALQAARLLTAELERWLTGAITAQRQPEAGVSLTKPLRRDDGQLDPRKTAAQLERQVRAYQPWPGSFVETASGRLTIWRAQPGEARPAEVFPGTFVATSDGRLALAAEDALLVVDDVQAAGGKRMSSKELIRGRPGLVGSYIAQ